LWAPALGCFGIQRAHFLRHVVVLAGAGVGGGSLNYANTLYEPPAEFYEDPQWASIADWAALLAPFFAKAKAMLGVSANPEMTPADEAMLAVASAMGAEATFRPAPVGVYFGPPGSEPGSFHRDPYFGGAGPGRRSCVQCGECMTGCRRGAKNTLLTNYLYLAERAGAAVLPMTTVVSLAPLGGAWEVEAVRTGPFRPARRRRRFSAGQVVLAAGTYGTQLLLHTMAAEGKLPRLSPRLGYLTRTNSESLLGAAVPPGRACPDFSRGVAITSSFCPEAGTYVEPVRYGHGSNMMGLFGTLLCEGEPSLTSWLKMALRDPGAVLSSFDLRHWSERTVIALVMQAQDNSLTLFAKRGALGRVRLASRQGHGTANPRWLPVGHEVAKRLAQEIGGHPAGTWGEVFGVPMTAHFLGGCVIGASPDAGVVDPWGRVFGYEGLNILDGSSVPANPGVNPALTIVALAERALSHWPNKGEPDPRPPLGAPLPNRSAVGAVPVVAPKWPAVPAGYPLAAPPTRTTFPNLAPAPKRS
jgi:cholesterol oxidase